MKCILFLVLMGDMNVYNLTAKQIIEIYDAGRRRGSEEECAFDWGVSPRGNRYEELEAALIWGDGIITGKEVDYDEKQEIWNLFKTEAEIK